MTGGIEAINRMSRRRRWAAMLGMGGLLVAVLVAASMGTARLAVGEVLESIVGPLMPFSDVDRSAAHDVIVWHLRLPRIVMAVVAGAGLGIAGATMQGVLQNPLVSPMTLGVSGGAVLGVSVAMILGFDLFGLSQYIVISHAFAFAMATSLLILALGRLRGITPESFILVGIALMSFFGSVTALLQYVASDEQLARVVHWTFGTVTGSSWGQIAVVSGVILICMPVLLRLSWDLNAMAAGGDEVAHSLGVNCGRVRVLCMVLASMLTAAVISFTGLIGFVGLVAPHMTRLLVGGEHQYLLPFSGITGAILLLTADTLGRTAFAPVIIPVGIVTSFIGAPFFFYLLMRRRVNYWS